MRIDVYVHLVNDEPTLKEILEKVNKMTVDVSKLVSAIASEKTLVASAVAAINGFPAVVSQAVKDALTANGVADAAAQTAADAAEADVEAQTADLQAALTANVTPPVVTPPTDPSAGTATTGASTGSPTT